MNPQTQHGPIKLRKILPEGYRKGDDEDEFIERVELEILEAGKAIGTAELFVIKADDAYICGESIFFLCDEHQETYDCGEAVYDFLANDPCFRSIIYRDFLPSGSDSLDVIYLSKMEIGEPFRKRGIGLIVLKKMMQRWGKGCALAVLKPFPLQYGRKDDEDELQFKKDSRKLIKYYSKLGFRKIPSRRKYGTGFYALPL